MAYAIPHATKSLPELKQRALELMQLIHGQKAAMKDAKKELDLIMEQIAEEERGG